MIYVLTTVRKLQAKKAVAVETEDCAAAQEPKGEIAALTGCEIKEFSFLPALDVGQPRAASGTGAETPPSAVAHIGK